MRWIVDFLNWAFHVHQWSKWRVTNSEASTYIQQVKTCATCGLVRQRIE